MNLLMISSDFTVAQGKQNVFYHMLREFSKYWGEINILTPKGDGAKKTTIHGNVTIHPSNCSKLMQPFYIRKKGTELYRSNKFDLVSVHEYAPFYHGLSAWLLWKKIKVPYIIEIHHIIGYPRAADTIEAVARLSYNVYMRWAWRNALAIRTVNSKQVPELLMRVGVPKEKIFYIPSFYLNFDIFKPLPIEKKKQIVFCGRLVKNKGIFLLLKAMKDVLIKHSNIKLVIIGSGPLKKKLIEFIKKQNLMENVEFTDWVPDIKDVARIYNESLIFVMPSFNEGGPRVTLEAMACEVPVISTKVGIMEELLIDGKNGLFIDWDPKDIAEKITYLYENEDVRKKIAYEGRKSVQHFEYAKMIRNYAKVYQSLITR